MQNNHAGALNGINGLIANAADQQLPLAEPPADDLSQRDSWRMPEEDNGEIPRVLECREREPLFNRNK